MDSSLKTYVPAGRTACPGISTGALKVNTVSSLNSSAWAEEQKAAIRIVIQKNNSIIRNFFIGSSDSLFAFRLQANSLFLETRRIYQSERCACSVRVR